LTVPRAKHSCEVSAILFGGLLSLIQTEETRQAHTRLPIPGPRVSDHGPLVLAL